MQRRAQLFGTTALDGTTASISRSKDTRTAAEIAALLPWVGFHTNFAPFCMELIRCLAG